MSGQALRGGGEGSWSARRAARVAGVVGFGLWCLGAGWAVARPEVAGYEAGGWEEGQEVLKGALLYSELGCAGCHGDGPGGVERRGPALGGLLGRAEAGWVRGFLADPGAAREGSGMPGLFGHLGEGESERQVEAVLHFLAGLEGEGGPGVLEARHVNGARGRELYHRLGCVACHEARDGAGVAGVPFPALEKKYSLGSLAAFLADPGKVRSDGRMPDLGLGAEEAFAIGAYLLGFEGSDPREATKLGTFAADEALAREGRAVVNERSCAACHDIEGVEAPAPISLAGRGGGLAGCLADGAGAGHVDYQLDEGQRRALAAYVGRGGDGQLGAGERLELSLRALHCGACHERGGAGGPGEERGAYFTGDESLGDAGRLPPPLDGVGAKLKREWLEGVLAGERRVRPYLEVRMPAYRAHAGALAALFEEVDGMGEGGGGQGLVVDGVDADAGRILMGVEGGMNCITCHRWEGRAALGIQAMDLAGSGERLRPEWFRAFLLAPMDYRPGLLMPPMWPGGQSMNREVLEGDTERQIASLWAFLVGGEGLPPGYPGIGGGEFELVPEGRPIIQRTFLEGVGAYGIVVGFPGGVHLGYDALGGRPALLWRGRFFDGYGTWFVRAAPFERPLGEDLLWWPGVKEEDGVGAGGGGFRGYRTGGDGAPTFLGKLDGIAVEETYRVEGEVMWREVRWDRAGGEPGWEHPEGALVEERQLEGGRAFGYRWR